MKKPTYFFTLISKTSKVFAQIFAGICCLLQFSTAYAATEGITSLGGTNSSAAAVNADGSVVVGTTQVGGVNHGFRWVDPGPMDDLGSLGGFPVQALAVNADGSVVVGSSLDGMGQTVPFSSEKLPLSVSGCSICCRKAGKRSPNWVINSDKSP